MSCTALLKLVTPFLLRFNKQPRAGQPAHLIKKGNAIMNRKTLETTSLPELLDILESYCYSYVHNPTKKNAAAIETIKKWIADHYG